MNILGIGFGEMVLISIVLLVVVGPERLPDLARQSGRLLVRARNWLQSSPDAALVLRARQEIEQELALLKNSLLEVQNVRDEVLGAARQLSDSVAPITSSRLSFDDLINVSPESSPSVIPSDVVEEQEYAPLIPALETTEPLSNSSITTSHTVPEPDTTAPSAVDRATIEMEHIHIRLQAIMTDLWALQEQLKLRGVLGDDWQPPSFAIQLSGEHTVPRDT